MSHDKYELFPAEAPNVPESELSTAMRWRIKDRLEYSPQEAVVEVFGLPGESMGAGDEGDGKKVYVVACRENEIKSIASTFHRQRLNLQAIDIVEMSLRNLAVLHEDDLEGIAMLLVERTSGMVLVTRQGTLYLARHFEIGLDKMLEDLGGSADVDREVLMNCRAIDTIALDVQRTLDYYESHFRQPPVSSLHIFPMEVMIPGIKSVISDKLGIRVKDYPVHELLEFSSEFDPLDLSRCLTSIGTALRKLE
ncbi:MAG: hypothetical protein HQL50_10490 [Magnetococcales bacterium]|nr:hypothetical protein [Magnetococcales bacterium]